MGLQPCASGRSRSTECAVRIGGSPIVGLQQLKILSKNCTILASELAEARLWDCNEYRNGSRWIEYRVRIGGSPIVGLQRKKRTQIQGNRSLSQNWRKPDCGIATSCLYSSIRMSCSVRIGGSPIVGLQHQATITNTGLLHRGVRIGGSPIVGLQPAKWISGLSFTIESELAEARLWDCNMSKATAIIAPTIVRIGGSPIVGLQQTVSPETHERSHVRIGGSPIVGLQRHLP